MDLSFRWRNNSTNVNNSLGLDSMIHDINVLEHQRLESVNVANNASNTVSGLNNLVKLEKKKKMKSEKPKEKKINIFAKH